MHPHPHTLPLVRLELHQRLLIFILEFHAWSTERPEHESDVTGDKLMEEAEAILDVEQEQGRWSSFPLFGMQVLSCRLFLIHIPAFGHCLALLLLSLL